VVSGDTCQKIETEFDLPPNAIQVLNPNLLPNCYNLEIGVAYCLHGIPPPPVVIPDLFYIQAENSNTPADGIYLDGEQMDEYYVGFNLTYGETVLNWTLTGSGMLYSGPVALYTSIGYGYPSVLLTFVNDCGCHDLGFPLICNIAPNLQLFCQADAGKLHQFQLIDNGAGELELALGDGVNGTWVANVDLFVVSV